MALPKKVAAFTRRFKYRQARNALTGYIARREYETQGKGNSPPKKVR